MQAAILHALGRPLSIEEVHDPVGGTGEVVVDVAATAVVAYAAEVFSGARAYPIELPIVPGLGAVGPVRSATKAPLWRASYLRAVAPAGFRLRPG